MDQASAAPTPPPEKPLFHLGDPLFVASSGLYFINRVLGKPLLGSSLPFLKNHLNDCLLIPAALPPLLWVLQKLKLRHRNSPPSTREIVECTLLWSFCFEWVFPRYFHKGTSDWLDVVSYVAGAALFWAYWRMRSTSRPSFPSGARPQSMQGMALDGSIQANSVRAYFSRIASRYDLANHLLSGGIDILWRLRAAQIVQSWKPGAILDVATGSGDLARTLQRACPEALLIGADFCEPMLRVAHEKRLPHLVVADALNLPFADASFDAVTVAFGLRNMASWTGALAQMRRVLKPGGRLLVLDFGMPQPPLLGFYRFYLHRVLPSLATLLTGERSAYDYLADSIESFPNGGAMCERLETAGFQHAHYEALLGGIAALYTAQKS